MYDLTYNAYFTFSFFSFNAALTHTSRPYFDLKTSKITFFFQKSFGFLSNFQISLADGPGLCSLMFSSFFLCPHTTLLLPWRFHWDYIASPRRPHGDHRRPRCDCATFSASLRRLYGDYCVCPATVLRLYDDPTTW